MYFIMRCMPLSEIDDFIRRGALQFGYPNRWVDLEEGRGDHREGICAIIKFDDFENTLRLGNKFIDSERFTRDGIVYCRRKSVMNLPTYCCYSFKPEHIGVPQKVGIQDFQSVITDLYFKDFQSSKPDNPMSAVIIHKPKIFF